MCAVESMGKPTSVCRGRRQGGSHGATFGPLHLPGRDPKTPRCGGRARRSGAEASRLALFQYATTHFQSIGLAVWFGSTRRCEAETV
jgi:hypothetical protein